MRRTSYIKAIGYTVALTMLSVIIHELGHLVADIIAGIPLNAMIFSVEGINPTITINVPFTPPVYIFYAGGLAAGLVLLPVYMILVIRYYRNPSVLTWAYGLGTVIVIGEQLAMGVLEGQFHDAYISSATSPVQPSSMLTMGWVIAAVFVHMGICPKRKVHLKEK